MKKTFVKNTLLGIVAFMIIISIFVNILGVPNIIRYIADVICFGLLIYIIKNIKIINRTLKPVLIVVLLFVFYTLIGFFINRYSIFEYLWGLRNISRGFIIFFSFFIAFEKEDVPMIMKWYEYVFYFNVFVCLIEFYVFKLNEDNLGGTFIGYGGTGLLLLLFCIEEAYVLNEYLNKRMLARKLIIISVATIILSAFAEIKVYFILFPIIMILSLLLNKKSWKIILIIILTAVLIRIGSNILYKFFPNTSLSIQYVLKYMGSEEDFGYSSELDVSRMRAFKQINNQFFRNSIKYKLMGFGLGSCDTSNIAIFNTAFYNTYYKLNYTWFSHAMLYLETGYFGYILYLLFFVSIIIECLKTKRNSENVTVTNSIIIISLICIITTWYNAVLRMDLSFFVFAVLALPFICKKEDINKGENKWMEK